VDASAARLAKVTRATGVASPGPTRTPLAIANSTGGSPSDERSLERSQ